MAVRVEPPLGAFADDVGARFRFGRRAAGRLDEILEPSALVLLVDANRRRGRRRLRRASPARRRSDCARPRPRRAGSRRSRLRRQTACCSRAVPARFACRSLFALLAILLAPHTISGAATSKDTPASGAPHARTALRAVESALIPRDRPPRRDRARRRPIARRKEHETRRLEERRECRRARRDNRRRRRRRPSAAAPRSRGA